MSVLFSDLDNTMIFSHHMEIGNKKIVVEHLDGREQSFMTEFTYDFFTKADWLNTIPVTTRTEQQYRRIECAQELRFKYAIICNGGKLLIDGKEDSEWSNKTDVIARNCYDSIDYATEVLSHLCNDEAVHRPEKYMSYAKCNNPESVYIKLSRMIDLNKVNIQRDGRKVYIFANGITKGEALRRFIEGRKSETIIAAGDNLMDVSMLNRADIAFANQSIFALTTCKNKIKIIDEIFSDGICKSISEMRMKGKL
mgnify:FL=1